jgi:hypothetical protein
MAIIEATGEQHDRDDKSVQRVDDEEEGSPADLPREVEIKRRDKEAEINGAFNVSAQVEVVNANDSEDCRNAYRDNITLI